MKEKNFNEIVTHLQTTGSVHDVEFAPIAHPASDVVLPVTHIADPL